jgi:hypothetical protein
MVEDKNLNKLINLLSFNLNLSRYCDVGPLDKQSPGYILEKYNHWIGIEPITDYPHYTPDDLHIFFHNYQRTWGDFTSVKRQLLYLQETESLKMTTMVNSFERYFGPIEMISGVVKIGLHFKLEEFKKDILIGNKKNIQIILRDMRLKELLK